MGERKTPQEMRCGNAEEGILNGGSLGGREGVDLRSLAASQIVKEVLHPR